MAFRHEALAAANADTISGDMPPPLIRGLRADDDFQRRSRRSMGAAACRYERERVMRTADDGLADDARSITVIIRLKFLAPPGTD